MQIVRVAKSLLPVEARQAVHQAIGGANYSRQVGVESNIDQLFKEASLCFITDECLYPFVVNVER